MYYTLHYSHGGINVNTLFHRDYSQKNTPDSNTQIHIHYIMYMYV